MLACLAVSLLSSPAAAESLRPHILIVFDTSNSMLAAGTPRTDGSPLCSNVGTSSRMYILKKALREALAEVGSDEANFGLARFPQLEYPTRTPTCPRGHYDTDVCHQVAGRNGCRMCTQTSDQTTYGNWFDNGLREVVVVDVTRRPTGVRPVAADFDPPDGNIQEIYRWIDLTEDTDAVSPIVDPELRGMPLTPLGRSIFYSRLYFENYIRPRDPKAACRTNVVMLVTDGNEACDLDAPEGLDLATCVPSGTWSTFDPQVQACDLRRISSVKTYVLTEPTAGATADKVAAAGGTTRAIRVSLTDASAVKQAVLGIVAETVPPPEACNGMDDNCNGLTDEGVSNKCTFDAVGLGHCAQEICDCGVDNDCDGATDEGFPLNACGRPICCSTTVETCNGLDEDCDGDIDEGFMVGASCAGPGVGACKRFGLLMCKPDGSGTFCDVPTGGGSPEICNGLDDDCDGMTDEREGGAPLPGEDEPCGIDVGTCKSGKTVCRNGKLECDAVTMGGTEICNGVDDDCDGIVDNGVFPGAGTQCLCPGLSAMTAATGTCRPGTLRCKGAAGLVCEGCIPPIAELCDGKDNDCDGVTDFMGPCPSGFGCKGGACTPECRPGEFPCEAGFECRMGYCVQTLCAGVTCPDGHRCRNGVCTDPCAGVTCPGSTLCLDGICADCHTLGCPQDKVCIAGACSDDLCATAACTLREFCSSGTCVSLCTEVECPAGQACAAGVCRGDSCVGVSCSPNQYCDPATGECKTNPCNVKVCPPGQRCVPTTAECAPDPCAAIRCVGQCAVCDVTADGIGQCLNTTECEVTRTSVRAGGGCGCEWGPSAGGDAGGVGASILMLLALSRSSRRSRRSPGLSGCARASRL